MGWQMIGSDFLKHPPSYFRHTVYAGESLPTLPGGGEAGRSVLAISPSEGAHEERGRKTGQYYRRS